MRNLGYYGKNVIKYVIWFFMGDKRGYIRAFIPKGIKGQYFPKMVKK